MLQWVWIVKDHRTHQNVTYHFFGFPNFDTICDVLQNQCMNTWNLFVLLIKKKLLLQFTERKKDPQR